MNPLTVKFIRSDKSLTAEIKGELDHHSVKPVREEIDTALLNTKPKILILDMKGIGFMDSSGLGLVLGRYEKCKSIGARLQVLDPSACAVRVLHLAGAEKIVEIINSKEVSV